MKRLSVFAASLLALSAAGGVLVVYPTSIRKQTGTADTCPGKYIGFATYSPTNTDWGFKPDTNFPDHDATDTNRSNTKVQFLGGFGDGGCAQTTVLVTPIISPQYRFFVYFTNDLPTSTNTYPLVLTNFTE